MADWGDTATYSGAWNFGNLFAYLGGTSPAGTNQLDSVSIDSDASETYRVAVYSGGIIGDPDGATLLEDLGTFVHGGTGFESVTSVTNPTLPESGRIWIAIKSAGFAGPDRSTAVTPQGDLDSIVTAAGDNNNGAWAATAPNVTYTDIPVMSAGVFLTYSAAAGGGGTVTKKIVAVVGV